MFASLHNLRALGTNCQLPGLFYYCNRPLLLLQQASCCRTVLLTLHCTQLSKILKITNEHYWYNK